MGSGMPSPAGCDRFPQAIDALETQEIKETAREGHLARDPKKPDTFSQTASPPTQFFLHSGGGPYILQRLWAAHCEAGWHDMLDRSPQFVFRSTEDASTRQVC